MPLGAIVETPNSKLYDYGYALPGGVLHVEAVYYKGVPLSDYEIVGGQISSRYDADLSIKYVREPSPDAWPIGFGELVTTKTEAYLLGGLNEDEDNARKKHAHAQAMLEDLRPRLDQQEPARAVFRSRSAERRLGRGLVPRTSCAPYGGL